MTLHAQSCAGPMHLAPVRATIYLPGSLPSASVSSRMYSPRTWKQLDVAVPCHQRRGRFRPKGPCGRLIRPPTHTGSHTHICSFEPILHTHSSTASTGPPSLTVLPWCLIHTSAIPAIPASPLGRRHLSTARRDGPRDLILPICVPWEFALLCSVSTPWPPRRCCRLVQKHFSNNSEHHLGAPLEPF